MRICASLSSADDIGSEELGKADMIEIRTDIFDSVPKGVLKEGQTGLISFKGDIVPSMIPEGWIADIGDADSSAAPGRGTISSFHDFSGTPCAEDIVNVMREMNGDILKFASNVNSVNDLATLFDVSRRIDKKHVILGMGELGTVTRIRQKLMRNEFTFAYVGKETAPGQMSVSDMKRLGDYCIITGIIGSDIGYTLSPKMHNAAFAHAGLNGIYLKFDTPSVDRIHEMITNFNVKGVNVTKPYKTDIIGHIDRCDKISERTGAVNTIVNDNGKLKGYNTDVHGIEKAFEMNSVDVKGRRALILGSGGAARSCAYFLSENDCDVTVTGRNTDTVNKISNEFSARPQNRMSVAVKAYDIIVNCIPLNKNNDRSEYPIKIEQIDNNQIIFDMVYGGSHLNDVAKERECIIVKGKDMLIHQGIKAFELFTSVNVPYEVMRDAL